MTHKLVIVKKRDPERDPRVTFFLLFFRSLRLCSARRILKSDWVNLTFAALRLTFIRGHEGFSKFHADRVIIGLPCGQGQLSRIWKVQRDWLSLGKECCLRFYVRVLFVKMTVFISGTPVRGFLSFTAIFVTHTPIYAVSQRCLSSFSSSQVSSKKKKWQLSIKIKSFNDRIKSREERLACYLIRLQPINIQIRLGFPDISYNPTLKRRTLFHLFSPVK